MSATVPVDDVWELIFSFLLGVPGNRTLLLRLDCRCLYWLSHLTCPKFPFLKNICVKTAFEQTRLGTGGPFKKRTYINSGIMHDGNSSTEKTEKLSFPPPQFQGYPGLYRCCLQSSPQKQHNKDQDISWNYLKGITTEWSGLSIWIVKEERIAWC